MSRIRSGGEPQAIDSAVELNGLRKDRSEFPLELSLARWETTDSWFVTGIIRDITVRKRAEGELGTLSRAVEQSPTSIVITDRAGNIEYVNPHFENVTGYTKAEVLGRNPRILKSGTTPAETYAELWNVISSGDEWRGELCNRRKNGELYFEYAAISGLKDENGEVRQYVAVKQDITERKRAEEALQLKRAVLLETERELVNARESLADSARLESVGRLAAGVAHEVKNPLMIIRLGVDYLAKQFPQESSQEILNDVRGAIERADNVIKELLDFAKQKEFARRPTDINQVIDKAIHLIKHEIKRRNIVIVRNRSDPIPQIYADPDRLVQVFVNLLSNAAQAIGKDGGIEVVARSMCLGEHDLMESERDVFSVGEQVITVDIRDSGPGFPVEHEKKIFEPFFTTKPVGEGTGLGLAVSRNIVMMHKGSINISNRSEGGASALLRFRVAREHFANE
jgi:PAS domain S-box-containing protein